MTDTAQEITEPVLDLDAMLADLHAGFTDPGGEDAERGGGTGGVHDADSGASGDAAVTQPDGTSDQVSDAQHDDGGSGADRVAVDDLDQVLPPGMVQFGDQVLPQNEVQALLELNRRVKEDPATATRVREAVLGQQQAQQQATDEEALPVWLDPDDQQAVFMYRQSQRIDREVQEMRAAEAQRAQQARQMQESQRVSDVRDAFRVGMKEFRDEHPAFDLQDLSTLANRAASMGLMENPEKVGGTLKGGIVAALEAAMWATPEYREKAAAGATVRTKAEKSQDRKQKSSALSSSTGSVVRTQSQEQVPTSRKEVMAGALDFLRSGTVTD